MWIGVSLSRTVDSGYVFLTDQKPLSNYHNRLN